MIKSELTSAFFKDYLSYDSATGKFFWLERADGMFDDWRQARRWNGHFAGKESGTASLQLSGYSRMQIGLLGKTFSLHRISALYLGLIKTYGENLDIDHIDGNPLNNKSVNLRACTRAINLRNHKISSKNTSGITGVSFHRHSGKFNAFARNGSKKLNLGYFNTIFDAACTRRAWELLHGYTNRHI